MSRNNKKPGTTLPRKAWSNVSKIDEFFHEIDTSTEWKGIVDSVYKSLDLPDIKTRAGLKKIHAQFPQIYKKLDEVYRRGESIGNEWMRGAVVGIWAKMSVDSILRDKLANEGLLDKIMPLVDIPTTRILSLQTISTITHHGGIATRKDVAKQTPTFLRLMQEFPDDVHLNELCVVILNHSAGMVVSDTDGEHGDLTQAVNFPLLFKLMMDNLKNPRSSPRLIGHAIVMVDFGALRCYKEIKALPPLLSLLVAGLRSDDIKTRCNNMCTLLRLNYPESEQDTRGLDSLGLMMAFHKEYPQALQALMETYGTDKCETTLIMKCHRELRTVYTKFSADRDYCSLGRAFSDMIMLTEYSVGDGYALPDCAKALRTTGNPDDLVRADICEMKFRITQGVTYDDIAFAERAIQRHPDHAYFYYAVGLSGRYAQALRGIKKGLKAKKTSPFIRCYMLWRSVDTAANMGMSKLGTIGSSQQEYEEGYAFLSSAYEDAKTFMSEAPPDARHQKTILNWYILLTIVLRGPELSLELEELDDAFHKLDISRQFTEFMGDRVRNTQNVRTREMVVRLYKDAAKEWENVVKVVDRDNDDGADIGTETADDTLANWLENVHMDDRAEHEHDIHCHDSPRHRVDPGAVALYRCSWCGNPSAVLKKCAACGKTRYCDAACQRQHWATHKTLCKSRK